MPKRRRLLTPLRKKFNHVKYKFEKEEKVEVEYLTTPRGRLKGALKDVLEPGGEESDVSIENSPIKKDRYLNLESKQESYNVPIESSEEEDSRKKCPQSYVLKLFDRSVDLSQFEEDSPLYPICRAWIANQPKMNYKKFGKKFRSPQPTDDSVELPGPEGPPVRKIPNLLQEQRAANKDNINLNYREAPPPPREVLLAEHCARWAGVRQAWIEQATLVESRYEATQQLLNKINVSTL